MASPEALLSVLDGIAKGKRVALTARVLARCLRNMDPDGTVRVTRREIATDLGTSETAVSVALATLRDARALICEHDRRKQVHMTIRVNPNLASGLPKEPRQRAQARSPAIQPAA